MYFSFLQPTFCSICSSVSFSSLMLYISFAAHTCICSSMSNNGSELVPHTVKQYVTLAIIDFLYISTRTFFGKYFILFIWDSLALYDFTMFFTWTFHFKLLWMVTPRHLDVVTNLILLSLKIKGLSGPIKGFKEIIIASVLSLFTFILF